MAKEKAESKKPEAERKEGGGKKKRLHLHEIRTTQAHDGSFTHHHTFKDHKDSPFTHPERGPMATSSTPEEAGQHVEEQFAQNNQGGGAEEPEAGGEQAGAPAGAGQLAGV